MIVLRCGPGGPVYSKPARPRPGTRIVVANPPKPAAPEVTGVVNTTLAGAEPTVSVKASGTVTPPADEPAK